MVPATGLRDRWLADGGRGFVDSCRAAAAACRGRRGRLQLAVNLWRNAAALHRQQFCLPAGIGACSHDELAHRRVHNAARRGGRVECQQRRQWWPGVVQL